MVYNLCMGANRTTRLVNQAPSRLDEHLKTWEQKDGLLKERAGELWKLTFDIMELEHSF